MRGLVLVLLAVGLAFGTAPAAAHPTTCSLEPPIPLQPTVRCLVVCLTHSLEGAGHECRIAV